MNFGLNDDQQMLSVTMARFLDTESSMAHVRQANDAGGFDALLWKGLAGLGAFAIRVPEESGGLGMGTLDAAVLAEEVGRTLASGPIVETVVAARLLAQLGGENSAYLLRSVLAGEKIITLAFNDIAARPVQWLAGGAHADAVIGRNGDDVVLINLDRSQRHSEPNLASNGIGEVDLGGARQTVVAAGGDAIGTFLAGLEEWKLLTAAALSGLAREAVRLPVETWRQT